MADDYDPDRTSAECHTITETVKTANGPHRNIDTGDTNHIKGEVAIEVSGAAGDRPHTYELVEAIEDAVADAVDEVSES